VERSPEVIADGRAHFADHCAVCHANDGSGKTEMGQGMWPKAPDMRLAATQNLTDGELFWIIENGIRFTGMPGWSTGTTEGETSSWNLVHFIRHLPDISEAELAENVTVLEVLPADGATLETAKQGERIVAITWRKEIPPKASAEFVFRARNPAAGQIVWKAHQHFANGTTADWIGAAGERRPASLTRLVASAGTTDQQPPRSDVAAIEAWLKGYDSVFNSKDLEKLATFYHPDVTIFEGRGRQSRLGGLSRSPSRTRVEAISEPAVRAQQHGCSHVGTRLGLRDLGVHVEGQDGRARHRRPGA